jgi:glucuronosyltransferase
VCRIISHFSSERQITNVLRRHLPDFPDISVITGNASLHLINTDISVDYPRPLLPNIKEVGGLHCRVAKPLANDLESFVSKPGSKGFVYFSLGSTVKGIHMPKEYRKVFVDVFASLKEYQVKLTTLILFIARCLYIKTVV